MALGVFGLSQNGSAADLSVTAPGTVVCTPITGLVGMQALGLALRFAYGSGGTSVKAFVQTSFDQGNTWVDIACIVFQIASKTVLLNFSGLTPKLTGVQPTDGALADDTAIDGLLGDRVRLKAVTAGTYADTLLSARAVAR